MKCSDEFQLPPFHNIDLSVEPLKIIPPFRALVSVGVSILPITIWASSTVNSVELIVVVVPSITRFFLTWTSPVDVIWIACGSVELPM